MTKKRKQPDSNPSDTIYTSKRSRPNQLDGSDDSPASAQSRIDPTYGQRGAFPGLDEAVGEDELFYGPANDGMEYLRMVRSEAKTVPNLLVAPVSSTAAPPKQELYQDYPQGYYADGAYTALPLPSPNTTQRKTSDKEEDPDLDPQEAYYTALLTRFSTLSSHLQNPPPLPPNGVLTIPAGFNTTKEWRNKILRTTPKMGVLALLQQDAVIGGLEVLEDLLTAGNLKMEGGRRSMGAWGWGLLARCRELGTMGSGEVGIVRRVGKRAVWLLRRMRAGEVVEEKVGAGGDEEELDGDGEDEEEGGKVDDIVAETIDRGEKEEDPGTVAHFDPISSVNDDTSHLLSPPAEEGTDHALVEARARIFASLQSSDRVEGEASQGIENRKHGDRVMAGRSAREGTVDKQDIHATLDMIVTIVGEVYGQRDLLDGRLLWDEIPQDNL